MTTNFTYKYTFKITHLNYLIIIINNYDYLKIPLKIFFKYIYIF